MSYQESTLRAAELALKAHVDECMEFAKLQQRTQIVNLMRKDIKLFSQCPDPDTCSHCHHAKAYIENFFDCHPELLEGVE